MPINQPGHFFDRLPAKDGAFAGRSLAYLFRDTTTGRYFFADSVTVAGATRAYLTDGTGGRVHVNDAATGARSLTRYGATVHP